MAQDYLEVLQLQGYMTWEDVFIDLEDFPYRLAKNLCFEKTLYSKAISSGVCKASLQNMLEPFYRTGRDKMRVYSFHNYLNSLYM